MNGSKAAPLVVVPMRIERAALGRGLPGALHVGWGPKRWTSAAARVRAALDSGVHSGLLIVGVCGALGRDLAPGDVVVATELRRPASATGTGIAVGSATDAAGMAGAGGEAGARAPVEVRACVGAHAVADALRAIGRTVHLGPVHTADHLVDRLEREALAAAGALAVDTESAVLAAAAGDLPVLVVRAVSDTPDRPLRSLGIVRSGLSALRSLRAAAPALAGWSPIEREVG